MTADRLLRAGAGLKPEHHRHILEARPDVGWFEVHAENYMGAGGPPHHFLERVRALYPLSVHGVGLSIGSADGMVAGPSRAPEDRGRSLSALHRVGASRLVDA